MFRPYPTEEFREVILDTPRKRRYAVSNFGRLISFENTITDGRIIKSDPTKYQKITVRHHRDGKLVRSSLQIYKLIAEFFIPRPSPEHKYVLHLDYVRSNDHVKNLRWATAEEKHEHFKNSPNLKRSMQELWDYNKESDGRKLTVTKVIHLKKLLFDPNRKTRNKILAKQFGISEMQLYRIKSGENWGHIKV